ncbi:pyridoxamine 5'-phosphate oxidase family protein [Botrimarina sp.]|uniref:pyridoxamine 5'-phosphate oxidase family protein n=1 Tax=Botrimarina sp. TaxID=2795802 RepID=UPI0032EB11E1
MSEDPRERFQQILGSFTEGMLVTREESDSLRGRPMRVAHVDSDADLWFTTKIPSGKTADIRQHEQVAVVFQDNGRYLTVSGSASITDDREKIRSLWQESWKVWFPGGQDDPELGLLHVEASHGEYWDNSGARGLAYAIRAGHAYWVGDTPDIPEGMNAKVDLETSGSKS